MENFDKAFAVVLMHEGSGFVRGVDGEISKYGLTLRSLQSSGHDVTAQDVENLTEDQAKAYYYADWWEEWPFRAIAGDIIAAKLFDAAVNMGASESFKIAQRSLNAVSDAGLTVDGYLGPKSLDALNSAPVDAFIREYKLNQVLAYEAVAASHPEHAQDLPGWIKRANWPEAV